MITFEQSRACIKVMMSTSLLVILSACAIGPDHEKPIVAIPENILGKRDLDYEREVDWWTRVGDRDLAALVDLVLRDNLSLKMALARIDAAQAQAVIARSNLFLMVSHSGSFVTAKGPSAFGPSPATINGQWAPTLTLSPDFWGRTRRQVEAADAMVKSQEEGFRGVAVLIVGQVARAYLQLRAAEEQLTSTRRFLIRLRSELQDLKRASPPPAGFDAIAS
jgi:outer membrane protein TolC